MNKPATPSGGAHPAQPQHDLGSRLPVSGEAPKHGAAPAPAFVSLARTMAVWGSVAVVIATGLVVGIFYILASSQHWRSAEQYSAARSEAIARSLDVFDRTIRITTENAYGTFRRHFGATLELVDPTQGAAMRPATSSRSSISASTSRSSRP